MKAKPAPEDRFEVLKAKKAFSSADFPAMANALLNHSVLLLPLAEPRRAFRICEVEFYLFAPQTHEDRYVHRSPDQLQWLKFYFHRHKNGTFRSGTYKGLDFTFGDPDSGVHFGVLLRSLLDVDSGVFTEGPCRCVNRVLEVYACHDVKEFVAKFGPEAGPAPAPKRSGGPGFDLFDAAQPICLASRRRFEESRAKRAFFRKAGEFPEDQVFSGPRIGLSSKFPDFQGKAYRFAVFKQKLKKKRKTLEPAAPL